jgi:hypothetical protein
MRVPTSGRRGARAAASVRRNTLRLLRPALPRHERLDDDLVFGIRRLCGDAFRDDAVGDRDRGSRRVHRSASIRHTARTACRMVGRPHSVL